MSRSVIGLDIGSSFSTVAITRKGGIDVLSNEASKRQNPSLVAFTYERRFMGESAATQHGRNLKNTVEYPTRLLGLKSGSEQFAREQGYVAYNMCADPRSQTGGSGAEVMFLGKKCVFGASEVMAMFMQSLKDVVTLDAGRPCEDVVISIPAFLPDAGRRELREAARVAGLNPLRLLHSTTAAALCYGFYKTWDKSSKVLFVDVGAASLQVSVVEFHGKGMRVLATRWNEFCGGRDFDRALVQHFMAEFNKKYGVDMSESPRALFRLRASCERTRKVLTVNSQAPLNVESLFEERDFVAMITREDFEGLVKQSFVEAFAPLLQEVLEAAGCAAADLDTVELVGGASRTPFVIETVQELTGKAPQRTTNSEEVVSKGCAIMSAILSPTFRTKDFEVQEAAPFGVDLAWTEGADPTVHEAQGVMPRGALLPCSKMVTFGKAQPFALRAALAGSAPPQLLLECGVKELAAPESAKVKVRVTLGADALLGVDYVHALEEYEEEIPVKMDNSKKAAGNDGDGKKEGDGEGDEKKEEGKTAAPDAATTTKKVKRTRKIPVAFEQRTASRSEAELKALSAEEQQRVDADREIVAREKARNDVESYMYRLKSELPGRLAEFGAPDARKELLALCERVGEWLYGEGEEAQTAELQAKLQEMTALGAPMEERAREAEERPHAVAAFEKALQECEVWSHSTDERYAHIAPEERQKVLDKVRSLREGIGAQIQTQAQREKHGDLVVKAVDIEHAAENVRQFTMGIMNKPKPKPKPEEPKKEAEKAEKSEEPAAAEQAAESEKSEDVKMEEDAAPAAAAADAEMKE